ncbi:MAG: glutaredoxin family protein [Nitrospiraceae bacterium]|jgi:glutaredoxin|nr:glutaredoxin family protein [Nitrospiraceae bacterium]
MVSVTFYAKEGCWFCDMAEEMLNGYQEKYGLAINKVDIASDEELYRLYRFDIPVLEFEDGTTLHGRIKKQELLAAIERNRKG